MAIVLRGKSKCRICGQVLDEGQEIVSFSPFVSNEMDPLWRFSDAAFHASCFHEHPLANDALKRSEELMKHTGPGNHTCVVCKEEIKDFDDYFALGHLVSDPAHPLYRFNYMRAHRSHLPQFPELSQLSKLVADLRDSGTWGGPALDRLLIVLNQAQSS